MTTNDHPLQKNFGRREIRLPSLLINTTKNEIQLESLCLLRQYK